MNAISNAGFDYRRSLSKLFKAEAQEADKHSQSTSSRGRRTPLKYSQRLDYARLAETLLERGLVAPEPVRELLQLSREGGMGFCEALVTSSLVADWELARLISETFQLPFLPIELVVPNPEAQEGIDKDFFIQHNLVPVDVFGQILTVAMPGLVPAEILAQVSAHTDFEVLPLVGSVESNRRWVSDNLEARVVPEREGGWGSIFDEADAEVLAGLDDEAGFVVPDPLPLEMGDSLDLDSIEAQAVEPHDLPPMPEFGETQEGR